MNRLTVPLTSSHIQIIIIIFLGLLFTNKSTANPNIPLFRIETGMHTAIIEHISVDAQGRYLVTGSRDKTVRVWDIQQGTLLHTLRPPIGPGHDGKIFAVGISPNGESIAAGGTASLSGSAEFSVFIFDRVSGELVRRINQLPNVVYDLRFSPDGSRVAIGMASGGLRIFQVRDGQLLFSDGDYGDSLTSLDFDPTGRLVTSSLDGQIRLYDPIPARPRQTSLGADKPYSVRFSPDGARIAVSYMSAARVAILASENLQPLKAPSVRGVVAEDLSALSWSRDGQRLCAGGRWLVGDKAQIRCWSGRELSSLRDFTAWTDAIYDLATRPDGQLIFASGEPAWGVLDSAGRPLRILASPSADFRDNLAGFRVDESGGRVRFSYEKHGRQPVTFSVLQKGFETTAAAPDTLRPARLTAAELAITGWQGSPDVRVNGLLLRMTAHEEALSLAIAPDARWFVLGTGRFVRCYSHDGSERWAAPAPGETQAVNISGDGRLVVAAYSDGTIRWYRSDSGAELLALFAHRDHSRWVLWTPAGYYDTSSDGESLIGWHIPRGPNQNAEFRPAAWLRETYHRPELVRRALSVDSPEPPPTAGRAALRPASPDDTSRPDWLCVAVGIPLGLAAVFVEVPISLAGLQRLFPTIVPVLQSVHWLRPCSSDVKQPASPAPSAVR